jgi:hypothetical protein
MCSEEVYRLPETKLLELKIKVELLVLLVAIDWGSCAESSKSSSPRDLGGYHQVMFVSCNVTL